MQPPESRHDHVPQGQCRWCGLDVLKRNGRIDFKCNWHKDCRAEMELVHDDALMRKFIWKRDHGNCSECSAKCGWKGWEINYLELPDEHDLELWKPDNISTLCWKCWQEENSRIMVFPRRLERPTSTVAGLRSIQLSYGNNLWSRGEDSNLHLAIKPHSSYLSPSS